MKVTGSSKHASTIESFNFKGAIYLQRISDMQNEYFKEQSLSLVLMNVRDFASNQYRFELRWIDYYMPSPLFSENKDTKHINQVYYGTYE